MKFVSIVGHAVTCALAFLTTASDALPTSPGNLTVLSVTSSGCNAVGISAHYTRTNRTSIDVLLDTRKINDTTPGSDSLAWTDSDSSTDTVCHVCPMFSWSEKMNGRIVNIDYDFEHRMDLGLLEGLASYIYREDTNEEEFYDYSYIYASDGTLKTVPAHATVANETEGLLLDHTKPMESFCIRTTFAILNRVGVVGATGELSKRSVFTQSINIVWQAAT